MYGLYLWPGGASDVLSLVAVGNLVGGEKNMKYIVYFLGLASFVVALAVTGYCVYHFIRAGIRGIKNDK